MADLLETIRILVSVILGNPLYLLLAVGIVSSLIMLFVVRRIQKIHSDEIYVHQAWGAQGKGR